MEFSTKRSPPPGQFKGLLNRPAGVLENPNFRRWFANSKVVDAHGKPMVVFHGTATDIGSFDPAASGRNFEGKFNWGIFFTNNNIHKPTEIQMPSGGVKVLHDVASTTYFAKVASEGRHAADHGGQSFSGINVVPVYVSIQNPLVIDKTGRLTAVDYFDTYQARLRTKLQAGGHDGVIIRDPLHLIDGEPETIVVALYPTQIKSAIGNRGLFDPSNPQITE